MFKKIALAAALAALAGVASAADLTGFYAGAEVGTAKFSDIDGHHTGVGALVGYSFNANVAAELGYRRLGSFNYMGVDVDANQTHLSVVGIAPLNNDFQLYGRLGYNHVTASASYHGYSSSGSDNKALYGIGLGYNITPTVNARLEVQRPSSDTTVALVGVTFKF